VPSTMHSESLGVFLAFKAVLELIENYNQSILSRGSDTKKDPSKIITSIAFGEEREPYFRSALQMRAAIDSYFGMGFIDKNFQSQREFYAFLTTIKKPFNIKTLYNP
jgi:hypothetical protein